MGNPFFPEDVTQSLPPRTRQYVLGLFHKEWAGNLKESGHGLSVQELTELANLYPKIWGEYVRKFNERGPQNQQSLPPGKLRQDIWGEGRYRQESTGQTESRINWSHEEWGGNY